MLSSIVLADGESTPVNHTFTFVDTDAKGIHWYEDQSNGALRGWKISLSFKRASVQPLQPGDSIASAARKSHQVEYHVYMPVTATVNGVETLSHQLHADGRFHLPVVATSQQQRNLRFLAMNLITNNAIGLMVETLKGPEAQ